MKIIHGSPGEGSPLTENAVEKFLDRKTNIQLATIDEDGYPNIQPTWFYYDKVSKKICIMTRKNTKKVRNIRKKPQVYFSIDEDDFPYRCVKGKAKVRIIEDAANNVPLVEKICIKYLGSLDDPYSKELVDMAKNGTSLILEVAPSFFSTWDFSN